MSHELIAHLTDRQHQKLDDKLVAQLKRIARKSDTATEEVFQNIWSRLNETDSRVRWLCLALCDVFFQRSRCFRVLLTTRFQAFVHLVVGGPSGKLPGSKDDAVKLRQAAIKNISDWNDKFGRFFGQLSLATGYFRNVLKCDIPDDEITDRGSTLALQTHAAVHSTGQDDFARIVSAIAAAFAEQHTAIIVSMQSAQMLATSLIPGNAWDTKLGDALAHEGQIGLEAERTTSAGVPSLSTSCQPSQPSLHQNAPQFTSDITDLDFEDAYDWTTEPRVDTGHGSLSLAGYGLIDTTVGTASRSGLRGPARAAALEALREAHRLIQRKHLPKVSAWASTLSEAISGMQANVQTVDGQAPLETATSLMKDIQQLQSAILSFCHRLGTSPLMTELENSDGNATFMSSTVARAVTSYRPPGRHDRHYDGKGNQYGATDDSKPYAGVIDPAAARLDNPYTVSFAKQGMGRGKVPSVVSTPRPLHESDDGTANATSLHVEKQRLCDADHSKSSIKPGSLQKILERAPILPPGDYLKLWEDEETQQDYVRQHMSQGQVYNHWGRVDDDREIDRSKVEDMLALRPAYYTPVNEFQTARQTDGASLRGASDLAQHSTMSAASLAKTDPAAKEGFLALRNKSMQATDHSQDGSHGNKHLKCVESGLEIISNSMPVDLNDPSLSLAQLHSAERGYNRTVLAAAGTAETAGVGAASTPAAGIKLPSKRATDVRKRLEKRMRQLSKSS